MHRKTNMYSNKSPAVIACIWVVVLVWFPAPCMADTVSGPRHKTQDQTSSEHTYYNHGNSRTSYIPTNKETAVRSMVMDDKTGPKSNYVEQYREQDGGVPEHMPREGVNYMPNTDIKDSQSKNGRQKDRGDISFIKKDVSSEFNNPEISNNIGQTSYNESEMDVYQSKMLENQNNPNYIKIIEKRSVTSGKIDQINKNKENLTEVKIATVLPYDEKWLFCVNRVAPAIDLAIGKMNPMLRKYNHTMVVKYADSNCNIADGINEAINFYVHNDMHVLIGPCCDYAVAPCARQVVYWDIPMVTAGGLAGDFGLGKGRQFRTLTRIGSNFNTLMTFFIDVLLYYQWKKIRLIYNPQGQEEIYEKYCHIVANDLHYAFMVENNRSTDLSNDYKKFEKIEEILGHMPQFIGLQYAVSVPRQDIYHN